VKTEEKINKIIQDGRICDLLKYFHRPTILHDLTYPALFQNYTYSVKLPAQYRNTETYTGDTRCFTIQIPNTCKKYYL